MKFKMRVRNKGSTDEGWWEEFDKNIPDATACANQIVDFFNDTIRPGERARELLEVQIIDTSPTAAPSGFDYVRILRKKKFAIATFKYSDISIPSRSKKFDLDGNPTDRQIREFVGNFLEIDPTEHHLILVES